MRQATSDFRATEKPLYIILVIRAGFVYQD